MKKENEHDPHTKKRIIFNAIHPAPYIDTWMNSVDEHFEVQAVYNYAASTAKTWSRYKASHGTIATDVTVPNLIRIYSKSDLSIFSGWFERRNLWAIMALKFTRTRVVLFSDYPREPHNSRFKTLIKKFFIGVFVDAVFCATRGTCDWFDESLGVPKQKLYFFPYGMSGLGNKLVPNNTKKKVSSAAPGHEIFRVFLANNFREIKGYSTVLECLQHMEESGTLKKFHFIIAGSGNEFEHYKNEFEKLDGRIELLGWIELEEYERQMKSADVFVHASHFEPFGIPPLDAISIGTPVIVSSGVQSMKGIITYGSSGYIFKSKCGVDLANTLQIACADRRRLRRIAQNATHVLEAEFREENWASVIDSVLRM